MRENSIIYNTVVTLKAKEDYRGITQDQENCKFFYTSAGLWGFPGSTSSKEPACQCRKPKTCSFDPWVGKIPGKRTWQPTPVFLPGEPRGQRNLLGYNSLGHKESDTTVATEHACMLTVMRFLFGMTGMFWN